MSIVRIGPGSVMKKMSRMWLVADHPGVQFGSCHGGLGTCAVEMHERPVLRSWMPGVDNARA